MRESNQKIAIRDERTSIYMISSTRKGSAATRAQRIAIERADALFEQRRVGEIHAIEKASLQQIEEKRTQLRELVGDSYKDVIRSADAILEMSNHADSILGDLHRMRETMRPPAATPMRREVNSVADEEVHVMGSRVKYVLDTQEVIWSSLDAGDYVEAARRFVRGECVYERLMHHAQGTVMRRFPFVEHLWPSIAQQKPQILDQVRQLVVGAVEMEEGQVGMCLVAVVTLLRPSSTELLQTYLQYRKLGVVQLSTNFSVHASSPIDTFCQIGTLLQDTVLHVLHLFLREGEAEAEIRKGLGEDAIGFRGFLFGKLGEVTEQELWDEQLQKQRQEFEQLSVPSIVAFLEEWLQEVAQIVEDSGTGLLLNCSELKSLSKLERSVKETLSRVEWQGEVQEKLGIEMDLWKSVFESVLQEKCLTIVRDAFQAASGELKSKLASLSERIIQTELEPLGRLSQSAWTLRAQKLNQGSFQSFRLEALHVVTEFDRRLAQILEEVSEVLGVREVQGKDGEHSPSASVKQGSVRSFSLLSGTHHRGILPRKTDRSIHLEPQIQSIWESTALHLAQDLEQRIMDLPQSRELQVMEVALLVGTVAMGLAENCPCMGLLAGPAEEWRPDPVPRSTRSSVKLDPSPPPHLSNAFRGVAFHGVHLWIEWGLESLVGAWSEKIQVGSLTGEEHLQEITMSHQATESVGVQQMKFSIPSAPSEQTMQLVMDASLELQRLGFYALQAQILHLVQFQLENKIRACLQMKIMGEAAGKLPDNYVLQLLFDFRFVCDVCSAGAPVPKMEMDMSADVRRSLSAVPEDAVSLHDSSQKQDPAVKRAILESQNLSKSFEMELSSLLDPIDWATSEPHLWSAEQRWYRRTQVLCGMIGSTNHPLYSDVPVKLPAGCETNTLQAVPVTARFQYLPVRPTATTDKGQRLSSRVNILALTEQEEDPLSNYSFSDLGQTTAKGAPSLQKVEVGSFTSLGTMFTDKAAEMSALAQQRIEQFGDYLQPSSLASSSIFSSFAKRVGPTSDSPL